MTLISKISDNEAVTVTASLCQCKLNHITQQWQLHLLNQINKIVAPADTLPYSHEL